MRTLEPIQPLHPSMQERFSRTLKFMSDHLEKDELILDLGVDNDFARALRAGGFQIQNTALENLDLTFAKYSEHPAKTVTAFEIFEHLLAPFNILSTLSQNKLVASVPLRLWFSKGYWNSKDEWDCHYHEFSQREFDLLLRRSGWVVKARERWPHKAGGKIGLRPFLRRYYDRYYLVYCEREAGYEAPASLLCGK